MFAFASAITRPDVYERFAKPGIERAAEPDSVVVALPSGGSIFANYNAILDRAAAMDGLEGLVLVHQDAEIVSEDFCAQARAVLADPAVGVAGCAGAIGVRSIAWWEGSVTCASFVHRYSELGGGDIAGCSWSWVDAPAYARLGEVETLDGFVLVLSPWAVRELRFDESLGEFHGYDVDFCLQVREAGRKVVTANFRAVHNHALEAFGDAAAWIDAHVAVAEKWDGRMPEFGTAPGTWPQRARRGEAGALAARATARQTALRRHARIRQLEAAIEETKGSISWRLTAPMRRRRAGT
jgi:hypothetical protein